MRVAYIGNFDPSHSTETHVAKAMENIGLEVTRIPEQRLEWLDLPSLVDGHDVMLWTRTGGFAPPDKDRQRTALDKVSAVKVGYHLDRWWGLSRETSEGGPRDPEPDPFFTHLDLLCTADGGNHPWNLPHKWFPPAIFSGEAQRGHVRPEFRFDIGFVGNMVGYGHPEWAPYRQALHDHLKRRYGGRFQVFPGKGRPQIRGERLADLYASVKVLVGDSCLANVTHSYWSDRVPETLGRGGFLIHPRIPPIEEHYPNLVTYGLGNFDELEALIDYYLDAEDERAEIAARNYADVQQAHLYEHRMATLFDSVLPNL